MHTIPYARQWIDEDDVFAVTQVLRSDYLTQGPSNRIFEEALTKATGVAFASVVANGTAALHLACKSLQLKSGAVGITSPITFAASANAFLYSGHTVAFADVDPVTGLMTVDSLESVLTSHANKPIGAVVYVSLGGSVGDLSLIQKTVKRHGWFLIEDAAQSLGATYESLGRTVKSASCTNSDLAILSFHPVKHICSGEGGAVLTNNETIHKYIQLMKSHGMQRPFVEDSNMEEPSWFYEQVDLGFNYRMTEMQAALGISQLKKSDFFIERRQAYARRYREELVKEPFSKAITLPPEDTGHAYHLFVVHFEDAKIRNRAHVFLKERKILTQIHHVPVYRHPYYERIFGEQRLPGAEAYYSGCLSIPLYPKMTRVDQDRVLQGLKEFVEKG